MVNWQIVTVSTMDDTIVIGRSDWCQCSFIVELAGVWYKWYRFVDTNCWSDDLIHTVKSEHSTLLRLNVNARPRLGLGLTCTARCWVQRLLIAWLMDFNAVRTFYVILIDIWPSDFCRLYQVLEDTRKQLLDNFCEIFEVLTMLCGRYEQLMTSGKCQSPRYV